MIATGNFTFKSFKKRDEGSFVTQDGELINFNAAYILKFDEVTETGEVFERQTKVDLDNVALIGKLSQIKIYQQVTLKFKAEFLRDRTAKLKLIDITSNLTECHEQQQ